MSHKPIQFFCRIRPPTQFEQLTSPSNSQLSKRPDPSRSKSPIKSPTTSKSSSNLSNHMYSIFSCPNEKTPEIVVCNENPIKGRLIEANLRNERDLADFQGSILENSRFFHFDHVFNYNASQNQIFQEVCKEKIHELLIGVNSTVLLYGPNS